MGRVEAGLPFRPDLSLSLMLACSQTSTCSSSVSHVRGFDTILVRYDAIAILSSLGWSWSSSAASQDIGLALRDTMAARRDRLEGLVYSWGRSKTTGC